MLMYSWAAICGVGAAPGDQGDQFPLPGAQLPCPRRRGLVRAEVGEHQGVLGRGGQAHRRAAVLGRARPRSSERLPGPAQGLLAPARLPGCPAGRSPAPWLNAVSAAHTVTVSAYRPVAMHTSPHAPQAVEHVEPVAGPRGDLQPLSHLPGGVARCGPPAGPGPPSSSPAPAASSRRRRPGTGPARPRQTSWAPARSPASISAPVNMVLPPRLTAGTAAVICCCSRPSRTASS